ncbi:MAG: DEAD/DEAH box helicase family protein [Chloroflexi bacterium]|nr:DEAD/DEAH box helicase family protein [Chloroflexota bacterium]
MFDIAENTVQANPESPGNPQPDQAESRFGFSDRTDESSTAAADPPRVADFSSLAPAPEQTADAQEDDEEPRALVLAPPAVLPAARTGEPDHVATAADFVVGAAARFEANLVAITTLKTLEAGDRGPTEGERSLLARFSGFGDSTFEPAFRLIARRKDEQVWVDRGHRLREIVAEHEWESLQRSRLNAFFTTAEVIAAMWQGLGALGLHTFAAPRILEPAAGIGRFLGLQPPEIATRSERAAVELDDLTARLLKKLYPRTVVHELAFQDAPLRDDYFDVAISNVPFGDFAVADRAFLKPGMRFLTRSIHNYFFVKALTKVRPGGVVAFLTSRYTLDAPSAEPVRRHLHGHADLLVAVRLPAGTFPDTEVVTDIVILRKRLGHELPGEDTWVRTVQRTFESNNPGTTKNNPSTPEVTRSDLNAYFDVHPEMVLGEHSVTSVMYGGNGYTVVPPIGGCETVIAELLERMRALPPDALAPAVAKVARTSCAALTAPPQETSVREGAYTAMDEKVFVCRSGELLPVNIPGPMQARLRGLLAVRDAARAALRAQLDGAAHPVIELTQKRLNAAYDQFVFRFGPLNAIANVSAIAGDPDAFFLRALERWDTDIQARHRTGRPVSEASARERLKMPLFDDIVIRQSRPATYARSARDAYLITLNERGDLDFDPMAQLLGAGATADSVREQLSREGLIFEDPELGWQTADAYLSGNVKHKLKVAENAALAEPRFAVNVDALRIVIPRDIPPGQIDVRLGTHWIPSSDVNHFLVDVLDAEEPRWSHTANQFCRYVAATADWVIEVQPVIPSARNFGDWGTPRASALSIVLDLLNGRLPKVYDELEDGRRVVNQQETLAAQEKAEALQRRFADWLWSDAGRADRLARLYNDTFNAVRPREYDGSHLTLPGSNPSFTLRPHQKAAVWRILQEPAVGLFHEVGAGKTTVMAAAAMELRRLGLAKKVMIVVPNDILQQFAEEFQRLYPLASLLVPGKDDFTPARRNEFMARIATGDWDAVIVAQSQFTLLPVHPGTEAEFIERELAEYRDAISELAEAARERGDRSWRSSEKSIQKAIQRLSARLLVCQKRLEERKRLSQTMSFEDLGVDRLYVDEAHAFKNLPLATRLERVKGLPNPSECQRATDMFLKTQWLLERGGGVVFSTGTPIANTIAESWTMARYLMRDKLEELGLHHFDAWAKLFAETVVTLEQTVTGAYRPTARFARFKNVPEWLQLFQLVADIRMGSEVPELERLKPRIVGGEAPGRRIYRTAAATTELMAFMTQLAERVEKLGPPVKGGDNMLKIASDARKAALDMRIVQPGASEHSSSKLNLAADDIAAVYHETANLRGVQLVFLDLGTPKATDAVPSDDEHIVLIDTDTPDESALLTDVYADLKRKLMARGVPGHEIRFVHEAKTREARFRLFQAANDGLARVIVGSTQKLGTGANVQKRLAALHHLDAPWRPMDIEQREGRGLRQGNEIYGPVFDGAGAVIDPGAGIRIFIYLTERSFDGYVFQAIEAKARGFKAMLRRSVTVRVVEDVDDVVLSAAEAKALVAGDPDVLRRVQLQSQIVRLEALRSAHLDRQVQARWEIKRLPQRIAELESRLGSIRLDVMHRDAHTVTTISDKAFAVTIDGNTFTERHIAARALASAIERAADALLRNESGPGGGSTVPIALYRGFRVAVRPGVVGTVRLGLRCAERQDGLEYSTARTLDPLQAAAYGAGLFQRLDNVLDAISGELKATEDALAREKTNLASYAQQLSDAFEHHDTLLAAQRELGAIERKLTNGTADAGHCVATQEVPVAA